MLFIPSRSLNTAKVFSGVVIKMNNVLNICFAVVLALICTACAHEQAPTKKESPVKKEVILKKDNPLNLYLLIGQSNMVGRDAIEDEDRWTDPRITTWTLEGDWTQAKNPLPHSDGGSNGVGPGMSFARVMIEHDPSVKIGLIPCAVGGMPLSRWVKGADHYENAVKQAREAMKHGQLKGILWHQGESDSDTPERANTYLDRLTNMF